MAQYTLDGNEKKIEVLGIYASIKNNSDAVMYASGTSSIDPAGENVTPIQPGESVVIPANNERAVFVLGTGDAAVLSGNKEFNFFKPAPKGGGGGSGDGITQQQLNDTLKSYATNASIDTKLGNYATSESVSEGLSGKVDTIEGMGLSSNDFTDEEKIKLAGLGNYDDTGIKADIARIDGKNTEQDGDIADLQTAISGNTASIAALEENKAEKDEIPTSLPADGGNADTVGGYTAEQLIQSNPNLLLNPDFKANQKGKTEYIGSGYTVDCWKNVSGFGNVTLIEEGVLLKSRNNQDIILQQNMKKELPPGNYTLSFKYTSDTDRWRFFINNTDYIIPLGQDHVFSLTFTASSPVNIIYFWHIGHIEDTLSTKWVKLELGSVATPFVPPNPLEEILKCGPIENESQQVLYGDGKWGDIPSNPNLLDNSDFMVNQRGKTEYTVISENDTEYTVDRWQADKNLKLNIHNDHITLSRINLEDGAFTVFDQILEAPLNGDYTISLCVKGNGTFNIFNSGDFSSITKEVSDTNNYTIIKHSGNGTTTSVGIALFGTAVTLDIAWMKLELGSVATPFVPPNPATELLKCQRYYQRMDVPYNFIGTGFISSNTQAMIMIPLPAQLRIQPTVSISGILFLWTNGRIGDKALPVSSFTGTQQGDAIISGALTIDNSDGSLTGLPCLLQSRDTDAYIEFSADL